MKRMENKKAKHIPMRMCAGCRGMKEKRELIRIVAADEGLVIDQSYRKTGRGAYLCKNADCILTAQKRKALSKQLNRQVSEDFYKELIDYVSG